MTRTPKRKAKPKAKRAPVALAATAKRNLRSRIVGEEEVDPATLRGHPSNWRVHTKEQREAMREVLHTVGWVQRVVVNKVTGNILDGHMRVEEAFRMGEPRVPVLYVSLTEEEERRMLAVFDPLGAMATVDRKKLRAAVEGLTAKGDGLGALVEDLRRKAGLGVSDEERPEVPFAEELLEEHNYLVLYFDNSVDWLQLQSLYPLPTVKSKHRENRTGTARVVRGTEFLKHILGKGGAS